MHLCLSIIGGLLNHGLLASDRMLIDHWVSFKPLSLFYLVFSFCSWIISKQLNLTNMQSDLHGCLYNSFYNIVRIVLQ